MGTRGFVGVVVDGVEHITHNSMDSGPAWLGVSILGDVRSLVARYSPQQLRLLARQLSDPSPEAEYRDGQWVTPPGASIREVMAARPEFARYIASRIDAGWGRVGSLDDSRIEAWWQWLTFESMTTMLTYGFYESNPHFPLDSLSCEWGYLLDLDRDNGGDQPPGVLEVYVGRQQERPTAGRWAGRPTIEEEAEWHAEHVAWCEQEGRIPWLDEEPSYKAVAPVAVWPLTDLPTDEVMADLYSAHREKRLVPLSA